MKNKLGRDRVIYWMVEDRMLSLREIGETFGISGNRVWQIHRRERLLRNYTLEIYCG